MNEHFNQPVRARLRGLARNPALPGELLLTVLERFPAMKHMVRYRPEWPDEAVEALRSHPDPAMRVVLAEALHVSPDQRALLLDDPSAAVRRALLRGPENPPRWAPPPLPRWAYERLVPDPVAQPAPLTRERAEELARHEDAGERAVAAADARLPADLVAVLATDPSPAVRLAVSMRPELSEDDRAAMVEALAADADIAVRLLLCERHPDAPGDVVLATYLEARVSTRGELLGHPRFPRDGLARLADAEHPNARALVVLDRAAPPELIERLSYDEHPAVRSWMAGDRRLSLDRLLELFADPQTTEWGAKNPNLPRELMERVLADAAALTNNVEGSPAS